MLESVTMFLPNFKVRHKNSRFSTSCDTRNRQAHTGGGQGVLFSASVEQWLNNHHTWFQDYSYYRLEAIKTKIRPTYKNALFSHIFPHLFLHTKKPKGCHYFLLLSSIVCFHWKAQHTKNRVQTNLFLHLAMCYWSTHFRQLSIS